MSEQSVASRVADVHDSFFRHARQLEQLDVVLCENRVEHGFALGVEVGGASDIDLVDDDKGGLVSEQRLDRLVKLALQWAEQRQHAACES